MRTADPREQYLAHWPAVHPWTRLALQTRNPLLRGQTRKERVVTRLAFAGLVAASLSVVLLCLLTFQRGLTMERAGALSRHQVVATVEGLVPPRVVGDRYQLPGQLRISYPYSGVTRTAVVDAIAETGQGDHLNLWVNSAGVLADLPQTRTQTLRNTSLAALLGLSILVLLAAGGRRTYDAWSIRQHVNDWDADWARFDPHRS